ncbi:MULTISPECIES: hypothetical protein [Staphylococcaceae]|uniref:Uncharacterized protein n=3 Tax=Staphylococcaceae TaxID=90964 RepID=B9EC81_MACCJ|nr:MULTISPECIES: hypothetical protein [Staphylococcaceae]AXE75056.1 hypothetical protein [Macrococcus canis]MDJ1112610.1 hypothetical protein [Macrococcus sp. S115]PKD97964.1 hypothetical protein CW719_09785 [Macrococcus caseolyticus]PKE47203.1 hypothetical protein CW677_09235 [Macrococcus caseolyticus]PKE66839.1 hypothetical protein CW663_11110 [Macrococcus caseolyticus]
MKKRYVLYTNYENNRDEKTIIEFQESYEKERLVGLIVILQHLTNSTCIDLIKGDKALAVHYRLDQNNSIDECWIEYCNSEPTDWLFDNFDLRDFYID